MATCSQTLSNITLDCARNMGGIVRAWFTIWQEGIFQVTEIGTGDMKIPDVVSGVSTAVTWNQYEFRKGSSTMNSTLNADETSGLNMVETEVALVFNRMDTDKRLGVAALSLGGVAGIVEDANGNFHALGVKEACFPSAGSATTGTARTDASSYGVTIKDTYETYPPMLTASAIADFKAHIAE